MNYKIISSGSKGNCTILDGVIALDLGVSYKKISSYNLKLVLLTHTHSDHFNKKTIKAIDENKPNCKFVCASHLKESLKELVSDDKIYSLDYNKRYDLGLCILSPFPLKHDVPNCGWRVEYKGQKVLYATDTSELDIVAKGYDLYLVEANYELIEALQRAKEKRLKSEYSYELRAINNHLSKSKCDQFLKRNMGQNSEYVYMHRHEDNNEKQKNQSPINPHEGQESRLG